MHIEIIELGRDNTSYYLELPRRYEGCIILFKTNFLKNKHIK